MSNLKKEIVKNRELKKPVNRECKVKNVSKKCGRTIEQAIRRDLRMLDRWAEFLDDNLTDFEILEIINRD